MRTFFESLIFLLLVPALAFGSFHLVKGKYNREFEKVIQERASDDDDVFAALIMKSLTVDIVCEEKGLAIKELCGDWRRFNLFQAAAVGVALYGFGVLCYLLVGGILANKSREKLLKIFSKAVRFTLYSAAAITFVQGVLFVASVYYMETVFLGRLHYVLLILVIVVVVFSVLGVISAAMGILKEFVSPVLGKSVDSRQAPALWRYIEQIAQAVGTSTPSQIILGLEPNFYVTEAPVVTPDAIFKGRTLYLSLPLCRILTEPELRAVVAHEMGHFRGEDTRYSVHFYPIYRGVEEGMAAATTEKDDWWVSKLMLKPAYSLLSFFMASFASGEKRFSRERELAADQVAVQVVGGRALGVALVKIHAFSGQWENVLKGLAEKIIAKAKGETTEKTGEAEGNPGVNLSVEFVRLAEKSIYPNILKGLDKKKISHPTDSHPSLSDRLQAAGLNISMLSEEALNITPEVPALTKLEECIGLEFELTDLEEKVFAHKMLAAMKAARE